MSGASAMQNPPKDVHILIPGTWKYANLDSKKDVAAVTS